MTNTPIDRESVERLARRIQTRAPYKSAMQIACEENISQTDAETVGAVIVFLGQGDYPTIQQIADQATRSANEAADTLLALAAERDRLRAALDEAEARAECAEDTLRAWFDKRKLGHEAVDQAVVDAASGYLRTSRVGGMSKADSDLVLGVIQDMARLAVFADLFARSSETRADRAAHEARAAALQEALDACTETHTTGRLHGPKGVKAAILALIDTPAAEALERVRAEEREQCAEAADTYATAWDADPSDDYFKGWIRAAERIAATIRARGET